MRQDINLLAVFDAVAQSGSVTAAARALSLSQPAVSHALNRLRDMVGDRLFTRSGRRLLPTPHAETMIGPARAVLDQAAKLLAPGSFAPETSTRRFRLAASDYAALTLVPPIAHALQSLAPGITLDIVAVTAETPSHLENGQVDVSFWGTSPPHGRYQYRNLFSEHYLGIARQGHPVFGPSAGGPVSLEDYLAYSHVVTSLRDPGRNAVDHALADLGRARHVRLVTQSFVANIQCVRASDIIATLPSRLCGAALLNGARTFPLPLAVPDYDYGLLWHERTEMDHGLRWFRGQIARCALQPVDAL